MSKKTENLNNENESKPLVIAAVNFRAEVLLSNLPVLVEFWTRWSPACRVSDSVIRELARDLTGKIKVVKINADDSLDLSLFYEIQSIPTLIYFVGGKPCFRIVGTASKEAILVKVQTIRPV